MIVEAKPLGIASDAFGMPRNDTFLYSPAPRLSISPALFSLCTLWLNFQNQLNRYYQDYWKFALNIIQYTDELFCETFT